MNSAFLDAMLRIPSTQDNPGALEQVIALATSKLEENGFTVETFSSQGKPSILAFYGAKRPKKFKVLLNGHLDVVPGSLPQFEPYRRGDRLFARGAQDMKSAAASLIEVFITSAKNLPYALGLQLVTDEEVGGFDGAKYQLESCKVKADFFLAAESTDFAINTEAKGIFWVKLSAVGSTAHGAYPWRGINAINRITAAVGRVLADYPVPKSESWRTCVNVARIETDNHTFNKVPDNACAFLDIRYIAEDPNFKSQKVALQFLKRAVGKGISIESVHWGPAHHTSHSSPMVATLHKVIHRHTKKKPHQRTHGASDARFYSGLRSEAVCFGPVGGGLHTDSEWVSLKSIGIFESILSDFLLLLAQNRT